MKNARAHPSTEKMMENRDEPILTGQEKKETTATCIIESRALLFRRWFVLFFWDDVDAHPSTRQLASRHHPKPYRVTLNHFSLE